jgi:DNA polymerase eta
MDPHNMKRAHSSSPRLILLLDLDCFYAQAECIRLGFDSSETSLALLQWNSVLAVTYPARRLYQIKRGDSWEAVRQKSKQQCRAVHVPLLQTGDTQDNTLSLHEEYESIYQPSPAQQEEWRKKDLGVRRLPTEGKACIERYRIASARISETLKEWIQECGLPLIRLERASIDEFYLDVTDAVGAAENPLWNDEAFAESLCQTQNGTVVVGSKPDNSTQGEEPPQAEESIFNIDDQAFWKASMIAYWIRERIRQRLGFTLSAGISYNKTIAKLSASYGKPNGQAVTFPRYVDALLDQTLINKCRNLGGKLGAAITQLLPNGVEPTVGNIRRYLALTDLQAGMKSSESASFVYRLANGQDDELVVAHNDETAESSGLTKSITAFKSFPTGRTKGMTLEEASDWIQLLATEIVGRVERDRQRNRRYPRSCCVQYGLAGGRSQPSRSVRIAFPVEGASIADKVAELCRKASAAVANKETSTTPLRLGRFGLCAIEFFARESGQQGMDAFLEKVSSQVASKPVETLPSQHDADGPVHTMPNEPSKPDRGMKQASPTVQRTEDQDLAMAKKLQASYDRENNTWRHLDKRRKLKEATGPAGKTKKISSFFSKR